MERTAGVVKGTALMGTMVAMMMVPGAGAACEMVTLERAAYGPYGGRACIIANSEESWNNAMQALEAAGALAIVPAPEPPADVNWANEAVILVAAGATGYDIELLLTPIGVGLCQVTPKWIRLEGQDGGESLPYHVVKMPKAVWLQDLMAQGPDVDSILPLSGSDGSVPANPMTWGQLKASYR